MIFRNQEHWCSCAKYTFRVIFQYVGCFYGNLVKVFFFLVSKKSPSCEQAVHMPCMLILKSNNSAYEIKKLEGQLSDMIWSSES
jgi:hypothetical protein